MPALRRLVFAAPDAFSGGRVALNELLLLTLGELRLGLHLRAVERVLRAVEITPLADAPSSVPGVINVHGSIVPVVDVRPRFGLATQAVRVDDHFVLVALRDRTLALLVDDVLDLMPFDPGMVVPATDVLPWIARLSGVLCLEDGMLLIADPDALLDVDEWHAVSAALEQEQA